MEVLNGIDIEVNKGEIVVLLGPSGSGKSTLLNIIGGIDDADEGYISIDGEKTADMNEKRLIQYRRKHLGYVFQMYNLIPNLTVRENIEVGAYLSDKALDTDEILNTLGLSDHADKRDGRIRKNALVVFSIMFEPLIDDYADVVKKSQICDYQYVLKSRQKLKFPVQKSTV